MNKKSLMYSAATLIITVGIVAVSLVTLRVVDSKEYGMTFFNDSTTQGSGLVFTNKKNVDSTQKDSVATPTTPPLTQKPNIVFILLDDLDEQVTPYWDAMPQTKALVADRGLIFEESFSPNPICCPARATLLTGLYSHNTGVMTNTGDFGSWKAFTKPVDDTGKLLTDKDGNPINNEKRTIGVYLANAGYKTFFTGKYLNDYGPEEVGGIPPVPAGWTEWHVFFGHGEGDANKEAVPYYTGYDYDMIHQYEGSKSYIKHYPSVDGNGKDVRVQNYSTDVLHKLSVDFIQRQDGGDPFFIFINPTAPHEPLKAALRHTNLTKTWVGKLPKNPNFNEKDVSDKSIWHKKVATLLRPLIQVTDDYNQPLWQRMHFLFPELEFVDRMGSLYAVDEMVKGVIDALEKKGVMDNTIIVFASDNGYNLGAHVLVEKQTPYDEALRVPLVIAGPGVRQGTTTVMVSQQDYLPTFLDLAGVMIPDHINGRSFKNVLYADDTHLPQDQLNRDLLIESNVNGGEIVAESAYQLTADDKSLLDSLMPPSYRGLRTRDYAYIEWYLEDPHEYELYDMKKDPWQLNNLLSTKVGRLKYWLITKDLKSRLEELKDCEGSDCIK